MKIQVILWKSIYCTKYRDTVNNDKKGMHINLYKNIKHHLHSPTNCEICTHTWCLCFVFCFYLCPFLDTNSIHKNYAPWSLSYNTNEKKNTQKNPTGGTVNNSCNLEYSHSQVGARCSSMVRAFVHGAMGHWINLSWWTHTLFLVPASVPQLV